MEEIENFLKEFEWHDINPKASFFDALEKRWFFNVTKLPLKIGFGHNVRRNETIAIMPGDEKDPKLEALTGIVVKED